MQLTWPDELKSTLEQQAAKAGCQSVDEYTLRVFLNADPTPETFESALEAADLDADYVEDAIVAGLNSGPAEPLTVETWVELRKRVERRLAESSLP